MWFWIAALTGLVSMLLYQQQAINMQYAAFDTVGQFRCTYTGAWNKLSQQAAWMRHFQEICWNIIIKFTLSIVVLSPVVQTRRKRLLLMQAEQGRISSPLQKFAPHKIHPCSTKCQQENYNFSASDKMECFFMELDNFLSCRFSFQKCSTSQRVIALHDFKHYEPKTVTQSGIKLKLDNEASRWMERNFGHDIFLLFFCLFLFLMAAVSCAVQTPPPCAALVMKRTATRSLMPPTNESRQRWSNQSIATLLSPTHTSQMKKKEKRFC